MEASVGKVPAYTPVPVELQLKEDCQSSQLSGGMIALIIIAVIVLVALVGSLAAFIQKQIDVNNLKKSAQSAAEALAKSNSVRIVAAGGTGKYGNENGNATARAPEACPTARSVAQAEQNAVQRASTGQSAQPIASMYLQGSLGTPSSASADQCTGTAYATQHLASPSTSGSLLPPSQIHPENAASAQLALNTTLTNQAKVGAASSCVMNQEGDQLLQGINAAMNAKGTSMMNQKKASVRQLAQVTQQIVNTNPGLAKNLAAMQGQSGDNDAFVPDASMGGVPTQLLPLQDHLYGQYNNGIVADTNTTSSSALTSLDVAFAGKPNDRLGITAQQAKDLAYNSNINNFAPQSTQLTADEVTLTRQNNLLLQCAAAKDPRRAAMYLNAVGASNPVTVTGMKAALARQPSMYGTISRPVKGGYGMDDAGARVPLALPSMSASPPDFMETAAAAYARASQSCTAASLL